MKSHMYSSLPSEGPSSPVQQRPSWLSPKLALCAVLGAICALFTLSGCATMEAPSKESMLASAGFKARTPTTAKQKEFFAALPAYKIHRGVRKGKVIYAYKDEKNGVVYVGGEAEYQKYKSLASASKLAEEEMVAHNMDNDLVYRWYGAWGDFGAQSPVD